MNRTSPNERRPDLDFGRYLLTGAEVVLADRVLAGGSVLIEDGRIADVSDRSYGAAGDLATVDLGGRTLMPGFVCLHNDAIEREINPRPGAALDSAFALLQLDRKLAAAGVTTQFHAVSFSEREAANHTVQVAVDLTRAIAAFATGGAATIDHHALLRLDLRTPTSLDALLGCLDAVRIPFISLNDHVPGQGQFRDIAAFRTYLLRDAASGMDAAQVDAYLDGALREAAATEHRVVATLDRLAAARAAHASNGFILVSHDDDSAERVDLMADLGCRLAEFPLTVAAAARARERGMAIEMGAANAFRGGSLSGNAGALELLGLGLVDILLADYYAPAMLAALDRIVALGLATVPAATRLLTRNPALAVGLADRGAIEPGLRADLIVVAASGVATYRVVEQTIVAGVPAYAAPHREAVLSGACP